MKNIFCIAAIAALFLGACKKDDTEITGTGTVNIEFENMVGSTDLVLNTASYTNAKGESFKVSTFKYYISNIELTKADGSIYKVPENYFLIDQSKTETFEQELTNVPAGDYTKMTYTIGVDSTRNFAGAQTGALDPLNGMFWTWNSGYIFIKLEGTSTASTAINNAIMFHIGGVNATINTIRKATFDMSINNLRVRTDKAPEMHFKVDVAKMFTGTTDISFAANNTVMGGANSVLVANNYASTMFKLDHIHN